jgi:hypothetical protein
VKSKPVCEDFDRWLDGELESDRQVEFDRHLPNCASCRQSLDLWRKLEIDVVAAEILFSPAEPQPVNDVQLSDGRNSRYSKRRPASGVVSLLGTTAAMILLAVGFWWYQGTGLVNPGTPSYSVLKFTSSGCPPGVPVFFPDPTQSPDHLVHMDGLLGNDEEFARIGYCATGEVIVVPGHIRRP